MSSSGSGGLICCKRIHLLKIEKLKKKKPKQNKNLCLYMHVRSGAINNSQKVKTVQVSISR